MSSSVLRTICGARLTRSPLPLPVRSRYQPRLVVQSGALLDDVANAGDENTLEAVCAWSAVARAAVMPWVSPGLSQMP